MKKFVALLLAALMVVALFAACGEEESTGVAEETGVIVDEETGEEVVGKVFNIYAWNEEFKGFFEAYYEVPEGIEVKWVINASDGGLYQSKLDEALFAQADAEMDARVDMFLAEADYIGKYVDSDFTQDISADVDMSNCYEYTVLACTDTRNGEIKGASFQCCPAALIYRKSIAEDVLGTSDPAEVQAALDSWDKFADVAALAAEKGYLMTGSFAETYRVFSNNATSAWVDENNNLTMPAEIQAWIDQTTDFIANGYTLTAGVWEEEKNAQMFADGKMFCCFGPAWYFNFCMGNVLDPDNGSSKDWSIVMGPQAHFWGGTWLLVPKGTDNYAMACDIIDTFLNDEEVVSKMVSEQGQYPNNIPVADKFANDESYVNTLGIIDEINDIAVFAAMTDSIKWQYHTNYDQLLNEGLQNQLQQFFTGAVDFDTAMANFYNYVNETYPEIVTP